MSQSSPDHFEGLSAKEHLKKARLRGMIASSEIHGMEMPGHICAFADSLKDTAAALLIIWTMSISILPAPLSFYVILLFSIGWVIWKPTRSAMLGWGRLERLHRLIEEERWEIEHNREQEKQELTEMYRLKGLNGKLLDEVIDVLMSDDNRLLQLMLEEELGLTLEIHEHPLRQAFGSLLGALTSSLILVLTFIYLPKIAFPITTALMILISAVISAKLERNKKTSGLIWHLASVALAAAATYFISQLFR